MLKNCPCMGCKKRSVTCHGTCKEYKEWQGEHEKFKKEKSTASNISRMVDEEVVNRYLKKKRKKER